MDKLLENIGKSLISNSVKASEENPKTAKLIKVEEARKLITDNVLILCGAGLSYASGIPTFRGKDGYWKKNEDTYECQKVLTKDFLDSNPELCWEWHRDF
jgi:NAD-dependent SIR2 family protein deacetylase